MLMDCSEKILKAITKDVCKCLVNRRWSIVAVYKSRKSVSRYVKATCGHRSVCIRVSDHPRSGDHDLSIHPNGNTKQDLANLLDYGEY